MQDRHLVSTPQNTSTTAPIPHCRLESQKTTTSPRSQQHYQYSTPHATLTGPVRHVRDRVWILHGRTTHGASHSHWGRLELAPTKVPGLQSFHTFLRHWGFYRRWHGMETKTSCCGACLDAILVIIIIIIIIVGAGCVGSGKCRGAGIAAGSGANDNDW
jgi:hypothetical protein